MDGELPTGGIKGEGFLLNWPNRMLAKVSQRLTYITKVGGEKLDQISRVIRYQGRRILTKLIW